MLARNYRGGRDPARAAFSWRRVTGIVLALLVQWPMLVMLTPASPWPEPEVSQIADVDTPLQLDLVRRRSQIGLRPTARARRPPFRQATPLPHPHRAPKRSGLVAAPTPSQPQTAQAPAVPADHGSFMPVSSTPAIAPQGYIPGGGRLAIQTPAYRRDADQLPGTDQIAHAPHFAMVAAEQQGIGRRVVNLIGSLTHATDPHCLDVAVWSGMSPQEQLAHYTSPARIADYTERYHCVPPPRY